MQTAILTACLTVLLGVLIIMAAQLAIKILVEPLAEYKKIRGRINAALIFHNNVYLNPVHVNEDLHHKERAVEVGGTLRSLTSELMASYQQLPFKRVLGRLALIPKKQEIEEAGRHLIAMSNGILTYSTYAEYKHDKRNQNEKSAKELARILNLYIR